VPRLVSHEYRAIDYVVTYSEELDMVQDMIVEGEVIAGYDIDSRILLYLPMLLTKAFALGEEICLRELPTPIGFGGLFQVTIDAHTGKPQNRSVDRSDYRRTMSSGDLRLHHLRCEQGLSLASHARSQ